MSMRISSSIIPLHEVPLSDARLCTEEHRPVVLVVDDEALVADSLTAILVRAGYATLTAYDGATALDLAVAVPPELLISDVAMPAMNGIELAVAIVNQTPDCKVLLFSGHATRADLFQAQAAGYSFTLIAKPVHPARMLQHVIACLRVPYEDSLMQ